MKYYFVDLRALPISERIAACKKMEQYAWEVFEKVGTSGLESAEVCWTSPEDFESSPCFPQGCKCTLLGNGSYVFVAACVISNAAGESGS